MKQNKLEEWITKREIQKHAPRKPKQYKGRKTFSNSLVESLDRTITSAENLLNILNKYGRGK